MREKIILTIAIFIGLVLGDYALLVGVPREMMSTYLAKLHRYDMAKFNRFYDVLQSKIEDDIDATDS